MGQNPRNLTVWGHVKPHQEEKNMPQVSITQFKRWCQTHKSLAITVCTTKAIAEVTREKVDAYTQPIFDSFEFQYCGELAEKLNLTGPVPRATFYLCDDPRIPEFYAACDAEHKRQGFNVPEGHCPALTAEALLIKAENALIEAAQSLFDLGVHQIHFENRRKYLDLLLGACLAKK
jgi:hypothetical protein